MPEAGAGSDARRSPRRSTSPELRHSRSISDVIRKPERVKKRRHAEEAARGPAEAGVEEEHGGHRERPQAVERRLVAEGVPRSVAGRRRDHRSASPEASVLSQSVRVQASPRASAPEHRWGGPGLEVATGPRGPEPAAERRRPQGQAPPGDPELGLHHRSHARPSWRLPATRSTKVIGISVDLRSGSRDPVGRLDLEQVAVGAGAVDVDALRGPRAR